MWLKMNKIKRSFFFLKIVCETCEKKEKRSVFDILFSFHMGEEYFFNFSSHMWNEKRLSSHFSSQRSSWNQWTEKINEPFENCRKSSFLSSIFDAFATISRDITTVLHRWFI